MKLQFNIRTVLVLTTFAAILAGWWVDRRQLQERNESLANQVSELKLGSDDVAKQAAELKLRNDKLLQWFEQQNVFQNPLFAVDQQTLQGAKERQFRQKQQANYYTLELRSEQRLVR